jgi:flagellin
MTVINTNTAATLTANALSQNQRAMNQTMERLSTGSKINSAQDDAAGLTMVSKMDAQIRGTNMAIKNANDAMSMINTADGAAIEIDSMLQRMRELAVQSLNETNTAADLTNMNKEFAQLATEIERVANETEFNDKKVLKGTEGGASDGILDFNIGANTATIAVDFADFNLAGSAATAGVEKITITDASITTSSSAADGFLITYDSGETTYISASVIANEGGVINSTDITASEFADVFNITNNTAVIAGVAPNVTAVYAALDNSITFTEQAGSQGIGGIATIERMTVGGVKSAITSPTITNTTVGEAAGGANVYAADLSSYSTAGVIAQASGTIAALDVAIAGVAAQRAVFGASVNRLEHTVDNLANVSQNTVAARSRIEDADYAAETTELARTQIIAQAATAMLSQANQQAQSVLALLK